MSDHASLVRAIRAKKARQDEALRVYRPTPKQELFHYATCTTRLARGGNRCLGGEQLIYDPKANLWRRIDEIVGSFHVQSLNPDTGEIETKEASKPFVKAFDALYEVTLSNGEKIVTTLEHRVVDARGQWTSIGDAWANSAELFCGGQSAEVVRRGVACGYGQRRSSSQTSELRRPLFSSSAYRPEHPDREALLVSSPQFPEAYAGLQETSSDNELACRTSATRYSRTAPDSRFDYRLERRSCGGQLPASSGTGLSVAPLPDGAAAHSPNCSHRDDQVDAVGYTLTYLSSDHLSSPGASRRFEGRDVVGGCPSSSATSGSSEEHTPDDLRSAYCSAPESRKAQTELHDSAFLASHPQHFSFSDCGKVEIVNVEFLRYDDVYDITVPGNHNYISASICNANSGKSTCAFIEAAHALTGGDIHAADGSIIPDKYNRQKKLVVWMFGYGEDHIGNVIYDKLFNPGAFWIIDDLVTGKPRIWCPEDPSDAERVEERRPAGPMIPERLIDSDSWSWHEKRKSAFRFVKLKNGNELHAFSSGGNMPQGVAVDLIHVDEDIDNWKIVPEWVARLPDNKGRLIWSAFPHAKNHALLTLSHLAEKLQYDENAHIKEYRLVFSDNPYIESDEKDKAKEVWAEFGEADLAARDEGEFPLDDVLMYPSFKRQIHGIDPSRGWVPKCPAAEIIALNNGEPPEDWMRVLALDPGSQKACALLVAIPPPEIGDEIIVYDEAFETHSSAETLTDILLPKMQGHVFQYFLMDGHAGRQTGMGSGRTVASHYVEAFAKRNLRSVETEGNFRWGTDNVEARCAEVRERLRVRNNTKPPRLLFYLPRLNRTLKEFNSYRRRITNDEYKEIPIAKDNDAMNCMEYIIGGDPQYVRPVRPYSQSGKSRLDQIRERFGVNQKKDHVSLGAPA